MGIADWCNNSGKQNRVSSQKLKMKQPFDIAISLLGIYPNNPKTPKTLLQGGHTKGPETYEKMLSITSHQKDAN